MEEGHVAMPLEPFRDPGQVRPTPVAQGLTGRLIGPRDPHPIAGAQQFYFIDKGRRDGVTIGDIFEVYKPAQGFAGAASEEVRAVMMIVHTRERSATGSYCRSTIPHWTRVSRYGWSRRCHPDRRPGPALWARLVLAVIVTLHLIVLALYG